MSRISLFDHLGIVVKSNKREEQNLDDLFSCIFSGTHAHTSARICVSKLVQFFGKNSFNKWIVFLCASTAMVFSMLLTPLLSFIYIPRINKIKSGLVNLKSAHIHTGYFIIFFISVWICYTYACIGNTQA